MRFVVFLAAVFAQVLPGQGVAPWSRPEPVDLGGAEVLRVAQNGAADGVFAALDVKVEGEPGGVERLPFVQPVRDVEVGRSADGSLLVLAGGVREGLDVYRFDPASRAFERYATDGGLRLRSGFGDGLGSWPLFGGGGLLLFAFEREDTVQFRAVAGRRVLASRALPLDCEGFIAELDPVSLQVEVAFLAPGGEVSARLEFAHPTAPRLALTGVDAGRVDFGDVEIGDGALRQVVFTNDGGHRLQVHVIVGEGFGFGPDGVPEVDVELESGASHQQEVRFVPTHEGIHVARLRIDSPVPGGRAAVQVRGVGTVPTVPEPAGATAGPDPSSAVEASAVKAVVAADRAAVAPGLERPEGAVLAMGWRGVERLLVDLALAESDRRLQRIAIRVGQRAGSVRVVPVHGHGRVELELRARALDVVEVAAVGADGSRTWFEVGRAPPALRLDGRWVVVHAPAGAGFQVLELDGQDGLPRRVLRAWRGRADGHGDARFDARSFVGEGVRPVRLQLMVAEGEVVRSTVLELGPSRPPSRSDRKN